MALVFRRHTTRHAASTRLASSPGPISGAGIGWHFSRGVLGKGPRLSVAILEAITRRVAMFFGDMAVWSLSSYPADLVMLYQPALDEIAHQLFRDALADWPRGEAARQSWRCIRKWIGSLAVSSLSLTTKIHWSFLPIMGRRPLWRHSGQISSCGRQVPDLKGDKVDLERTRALFLSNGWVVITTQHRGGIVSPHAYTTTLQDVEYCLQTPLRLPDGQELRLQCRRDLWPGTAPRRGISLSGHRPRPNSDPTSMAQCTAHQKWEDITRLLTILAISAGAPRRLWTGLTSQSLPSRNSGVVELVRHALAL